MKIKNALFILGIVFLGLTRVHANTFSRQDTLRGSNTPERSWWNLLHYELWVLPDIQKKSISGKNYIQFQKINKGHVMQIDLRYPMRIDSVHYHHQKIEATFKDSVYYLNLAESISINEKDSVLIFFSGQPKEAILPPWDGGWIWKKDEEGNPFVSVACQGLGASVWFPCKDYLGDEPDYGVIQHIAAPKKLSAIGNGNLLGINQQNESYNIWTWEVKNPINNYCIIPYIGNYTVINTSYNGLSGKLNCSFFSLVQDSAKARKQFAQVPLMLDCFERWFGPYPFYQDGYKMVQAPHLGMEHQSAIAYGNGFENGYKGKDLSESGQGLKWDFIIIHESGHEWFGNNISSSDLADLWVHEAFTNYSETVYTECCCGKEAGKEYVKGIRKKIKNDRPICGPNGVNQEGSTDMYYKGGNLIHLIRILMDDDEKFRQMLIAMNKNFRHSIISGKQMEEFMIQESGLPIQSLFDQYLRHEKPPTLWYRQRGRKVQCGWENCVPGFSMKIQTKNGRWIVPAMEGKKSRKIILEKGEKFEVSDDFYLLMVNKGE